MRKKAKYLHDTPDDALTGEIIHDGSPVKTVPILSKTDSSRNTTTNFTSRAQAGDIYGVGVADGGFGVAEEDFGRSSRMSDTRQSQQGMPTFRRLNSGNSGIAPEMSFDNVGMSGTPAAGFQQSAPPLPQMTSAFDPTFFDANDLNFFDTSNMDFGNHYGAMEFGMLGQMSSGAGANNDMFVRPSLGSHRYSTTFNSNGLVNGFLPLNGPLNMNGRTSVTDWQANPLNQGLTMNSWNTNFTPELGLKPDSMSNEPNAFTIGAVPGYAHTGSPASSIDFLLRYDDTPTITDTNMTGMQPAPSGFLQLTDSPNSTNRPPNHQDSRNNPMKDPPTQPPSAVPTAAPTPNLTTRKLDLSHLPLNPSAKRARDPAAIYASTTTPYPYTLAFHALTSVLHRRLPPPSRLLIAQALASIRPSFISCTRTLIHDDLVFMEKCFQRQLLEYEEFIAKVGTPTVVCRRTGEVAGVGKEFCLLTGWDRDVLLGLKPNGNANVGRGGGGGGSTSTGTTSRPNGTAGQTGGVATPRVPTSTAGANAMDAAKDGAAKMTATTTPRIQPVFLAELLDDASLIRFYEDFAKLAFADSKGSAWSPCKLLRYRSKEEMLRRGLEREKRREADMEKEKEDRKEKEKEKEKEKDVDVVECMWCWTVKRDVFDIPMMIVINVSPGLW